MAEALGLKALCYDTDTREEVNEIKVKCVRDYS